VAKQPIFNKLLAIIWLSTIVNIASATNVSAPEAEIKEAKRKPVDVISINYYTAWQQNLPIPLLSIEQSQLGDPYQLQRAYVSLRLTKDKLKGFKAGLTSKAGQHKFGVEQALAGVLLQSGSKTNNSSVSLSDYRKLMIETELGFSVNQTLTKKVESIDQLKALTSAIHPVIELPDIGFAKEKPATGTDLIASNLGSAAYIVGPPTPLNQLGTSPALTDINALAVSLTVKNKQGQGKIVNQGKATDALDNQWHALMFLINHSIEQGYQITPDHILITGALGQMIPALPGDYTAQFGPLKSLEFTITR